MPTSDYDIQRIRKQMKDRMTSNPMDPFEFRLPKLREGETAEYKCFVLPPLSKGDKCAGGITSRDMELFAVKTGEHWVNRRPYPCPRVHLGLELDCEMCQTGFDLMDEETDKDRRRAIAKHWLSQTQYIVNLYFTNSESNPEPVRGKVLYYKAPKTVFDHWSAALYRDGPGDADDPQAHGVFYDEQAAFMYKLIAIGGKQYPDYKTSKFIVGTGRVPIAAGPDKKPDQKGIQRILDSRVDIFTKISEPNPAAIHRLTKQMLDGTDDIKPTTPEDVGAQPVVESNTAVAAPAAETVQARPAKQSSAKAQPKPAQPTTPAQDTTKATKPKPAPAKVDDDVVVPADDADGGADSDFDDDEGIRSILNGLRKQDDD